MHVFYSATQHLAYRVGLVDEIVWALIAVFIVVLVQWEPDLDVRLCCA